MKKMLQVNHVSGGYPGNSVIKDLSFSVARGEFFGIIGPNGSGKTTLLKIITGLVRIDSGDVLIKNKPLPLYSPKELAKIVAVLPQMSVESFAYRVKETVALGRYAHQKGLFPIQYNEDEEIIYEAMKMTGVEAYENKLLQELSGGERQRVFLAQALAQEPEILCLDEPTNHLDLSYQKDLLDQLKSWSQSQGMTIISVFHDLNLASLYCDRLLLLDHGKRRCIGQPNEVLRVSQIEHVYRTHVANVAHPTVPKSQLVLVPNRSLSNNRVIMINEEMVRKADDRIELHSPIPLKSFSLKDAHPHWYRIFQNIAEQRANMEGNLEGSETLTMQTKAQHVAVESQWLETNGFSVYIMAMVGMDERVSNESDNHHSINIWIFINGKVANETLIQAMMTATEARTKALVDCNNEYSIAANTAAHHKNILVAATQMGDMAIDASELHPILFSGISMCMQKLIKIKK